MVIGRYCWPFCDLICGLLIQTCHHLYTGKSIHLFIRGVWPCWQALLSEHVFCGKLPTTLHPGIFRTLLHKAPEGECSNNNMPWKVCSNEYLLNSVSVGM